MGQIDKRWALGTNYARWMVGLNMKQMTCESLQPVGRWWKWLGLQLDPTRKSAVILSWEP